MTEAKLLNPTEYNNNQGLFKSDFLELFIVDLIFKDFSRKPSLFTFTEVFFPHSDIPVTCNTPFFQIASTKSFFVFFYK